jgi:Tol biopolymer transport system component
LPYQVYTPTPVPENLETVQAAAAVNGLPAVLLLTPTPASAATATEQAAYATAVALTTGTFTPVPTNFVTPIVVPPSPPAQNVATAAARAVAATAAAQAPASDGLLPTATPTPLPYNAVLGVYVYATPVFIATNAATAVAYNKEMNDAILATGTPTPLPWNAIVITSVPTPVPPSPTPIPLFIPASELTATPTPSPTRITPSELPAEVRGKILFKSDRGGAEAIYMLDPVTGEVTLITQPWVFDLAQQRLPMSSDGAHRALVRQDDDGNLQIFDESLQYGTTRKVTALGGTNYDPAWAPTGDWIAFVSTNTGGDEIYRVDPTGAVAQRLTTNSWEWDKHPTWAPDASQIVFYSNREGGRRQLWIMDADGANQRNLSSNEYNDWDPIWVP